MWLRSDVSFHLHQKPFCLFLYGDFMFDFCFFFFFLFLLQYTVAVCAYLYLVWHLRLCFADLTPAFSAIIFQATTFNFLCFFTNLCLTASYFTQFKWFITHMDMSLMLVMLARVNLHLFHVHLQLRCDFGIIQCLNLNLHSSHLFLTHLINKVTEHSQNFRQPTVFTHWQTYNPFNAHSHSDEKKI